MTRMDNKRIKGLPVVSIAEGEKLGTIARAFVDPTGLKLVGFAVDGSGRSSLAGRVTGLVSGGAAGTDATAMLRVDDVHALGPDALTVDDRAKVRFGENESMGDGLLDLEELTGRRVVTENGTYVGNVASIAFDPASFRVTEVEASPGFFKSNTAVPVDLITSVGGDLIVVSDAVCAPEPEPEAAEAGERGRHVVVEDRTGNAAAPST
jgi:uncharacterized protein YrrD